MNNNFKLLTILFVMVVIFSSCQSENKVRTFNDTTYLKDIYKIIEKEEFFVGKIEGNTIELENRDFKIIKRLEFQSKSKVIKIISILNENNQIYFVLNGFIDDSNGIVFCRSENINMEGLYKLIRIEGNAYYYQTYKD